MARQRSGRNGAKEGGARASSSRRAAPCLAAGSRPRQEFRPKSSSSSNSSSRSPRLLTHAPRCRRSHWSFGGLLALASLCLLSVAPSAPAASPLARLSWFPGLLFPSASLCCARRVGAGAKKEGTRSLPSYGTRETVHVNAALRKKRRGQRTAGPWHVCVDKPSIANPAR